MAELMYGFIWVVFVRLESGSTRLSVNFPHALGSLWHPMEGNKSRSKSQVPLATCSLPGPPTVGVTLRCSEVMGALS